MEGSGPDEATGYRDSKANLMKLLRAGFTNISAEEPSYVERGHDYHRNTD
ncbi:MAG: hypothetical protein ABSB94_18745 [Syntrophorhabdales bacterium]